MPTNAQMFARDLMLLTLLEFALFSIVGFIAGRYSLSPAPAPVWIVPGPDTYTMPEVDGTPTPAKPRVIAPGDAELVPTPASAEDLPGPMDNEDLDITEVDDQPIIRLIPGAKIPQSRLQKGAPN